MSQAKNNAGGPEEPVCYVGGGKADLNRHDGGLRPVVGVHNFQAMRANRENPEQADGCGWTYNHQPYLAYWQGTFYLEYLSGPAAEHEDRGQTLLMTSRDGRSWSKPVVIFPPYRFEDGSYSIMHQRMGFYTSTDNRLLALAFYGASCPWPWPDRWDSPNNGKGVGRAVREVYEDGSFGPIYFIRYNAHAGWHEGNTQYPFYRSAPDAGFVGACDELLANKLMTQQWWEEDKSEDGFYRVKDVKALSFYHRSDGKAVGLWKWAKCALSEDEGQSWSPVVVAPTLTMAGAKVWGQKTSDGRYVLVYNPSPSDAHRWPLALVSGEDGITFDQMLAVHGEVPPMRYQGFCKNEGPQYVRGIDEGNGTPPDGALWLTYSVNKEDIWVSRVPLPIRERVQGPVQDDFSDLEPTGFIKDWNIYSGQWTAVQVVDDTETGRRCLELRDRDPYDYARAMRVFEECRLAHIAFDLRPAQSEGGWLEIEVQDMSGRCPLRITLDNRNWMLAAQAKGYRNLKRYQANTWYHVDVLLDAQQGRYDLRINDESVLQAEPLLEAVETVERIVFRTGPYRSEPNLNTTMLVSRPDLPNGGVAVQEAVYAITNVCLEAVQPHP